METKKKKSDSQSGRSTPTPRGSKKAPNAPSVDDRHLIILRALMRIAIDSGEYLGRDGWQLIIDTFVKFNALTIATRESESPANREVRDEMDEVFLSCSDLSDGALVHAVSALCQVATSFLRKVSRSTLARQSGSVHGELVFCVEKLKVIAEHNAKRIPLFWNLILEEHVRIACSEVAQCLSCQGVA